MIYYPLTTLMLAGIREVLIITTPKDLKIFEELFSDGSKLGMTIKYRSQSEPKGLADAFIISEQFISDNHSALILGDNLFYGHKLKSILENTSNNFSQNATIFAHLVNDPNRYGIVEFDSSSKVISVEEKPQYPKSNYAISGLYFYDNTVCERAKTLKPSLRGELEITDLNNLYLNDQKLEVKLLGRGMVWLDTGTYESLHEASSYIKTIENRQGLKIGCPEEVAFRMGWITKKQVLKQAENYLTSPYGEYLMKVIEERE